MRSLIKLVFLFSFISNTVFSQAEDSNILMNNGYFGYSQYRPNFKPKNFEAVGDWHGFEYAAALPIQSNSPMVNSGFFFINYYDGALRSIDADSTTANAAGRFYRIGLQMGKKMEYGKHSFLSVGLEPFVRIGASLAQIPNKNVNTRVSSSGLVGSFGLLVKLSHLYFIYSYDGGAYINTVWSGGNGRHNLMKGVTGGSTFTIGFNNAFELLTPKYFQLNGLDIYKRTYVDQKKKYDVNRGEFYREITTTVITKSTPGQRSLTLMAPFWGVGPSISMKSRKNRQAETFMYGANLGFRFGYLMVDGFYEEGLIGTEDETSKDEILTTYPILRDYDFSAQLDARHYGARLGLNLLKFFALKVNFEQDDESRKKSKWPVTFARLNVFYTMGQTDFIAPPDYTYEGASARLIDFQDQQGITSNTSNNPDLVPASTLFSGWGVSAEMGAVYFNATWYTYQDAAVANHLQYTIGINVPVVRLTKSLRARFINLDELEE